MDNFTSIYSKKARQTMGLEDSNGKTIYTKDCHPLPPNCSAEGYDTLQWFSNSIKFPTIGDKRCIYLDASTFVPYVFLGLGIGYKPLSLEKGLPIQFIRGIDLPSEGKENTIYISDSRDMLIWDEESGSYVSLFADISDEKLQEKLNRVVIKCGI